MTDKLKACPFCGEPYMQYEDFVYCGTCGVQVDSGVDEQTSASPAVAYANAVAEPGALDEWHIAYLAFMAGAQYGYNSRTTEADLECQPKPERVARYRLERDDENNEMRVKMPYHPCDGPLATDAPCYPDKDGREFSHWERDGDFWCHDLPYRTCRPTPDRIRSAWRSEPATWATHAVYVMPNEEEEK